MNLGRYFTQKGIQISGYYGRNINNASKAAKITNSKLYTNYEKIIKDSDILFITTSDDIISIVDREISKFDLKNKSVCHASGSLKSTLLSNAKLSGALIYSIHPMFAFSNKNIPISELEKIYFSIEGDINTQINDDIPVIALLNSLGNKYFVRDLKDSATYHLANVFVSNLVLSLLDIGTGYLKTLGLSEEDAFEALFPLIEGNIKNIQENGFVNSLTGPAARGDVETIKKHLEALNNEDKCLYNSLSLNLLKLVGMRKLQEQENREKDCEINCFNKEDALRNLLNESEKYREIFRLLGGKE